MNQTAVKGWATLLLAALSTHLGLLAVPVGLLLAAMLLDYITGLLAAKHRNQGISSYRSALGITKKICLLMLVGVGLLLDCLLLYGATAFQLPVSWPCALSVTIAVWLTVSEAISILENIQDITGSLPGWLLPLVRNIRRKVDTVASHTGEEPLE